MPDWLETIVRTFFAVIVLFIMTRLLGKRQISQLSFFEYITGITIGSLTAYISTDLTGRWYLGFIALFVWVGFSLAVELLQMRSRTLRKWFDSKATVVIKDGKVLEDNLKKERLSSDDLLELLRKKNVFKAADVEFAVMEPNGELNVLLQRDKLPLTPSHLGIKVGPEQEPQAVIMEGKVMDEPLATMGLSREWLHTQLEKMGVSIDNVFLGQVDTYGQLYIDTFDDKLKLPQPQEKAALLATLKKCEADVEMFGLSTSNEQSKQLYLTCSETLQDVIRMVTPYLHR